MLIQTSLKRELLAHTLKVITLRVFAVVFAIGLAGFVTSTVRPGQASATTSNTINFQARLESSSGAIAPDGNYNIEFKLYTALTPNGTPDQGACTYNSGTTDPDCLWVETRIGGNTVKVVNGYLTVDLGSVAAFPANIDWSQQLYLTMNIGGTGATPSWDGEMSPRLKLTAVPYAFAAQHANQADELQVVSGGNTATLSIAAPTNGNQTFIVPDQGAAGTYSLLTQTAADGSYIQNQYATPQLGNIYLQTADGGQPTLQIKQASGQSADYLDIRDSNNALISKVDSSGHIAAAGFVDMTGTGSYLDFTSGASGGAAVLDTRLSSNIGLVLRGQPGQSKDLLELQNSSGDVLSKFDQNGNLQVGGINSVASSSAFQVQSTGGTALLNADTSANKLQIAATEGVTTGSVTTNVHQLASYTGGSYISSSMQLGSDNLPRYSYIDNGGSIQYVQCANADCSTSNAHTIATAANQAMVLGTDDMPRIVYIDSSGNLKFIRCTAQDCSTMAPIVTIATDADPSAGPGWTAPSLVLDSSNDPFITYDRASDDHLVVVACSAVDCSSKTVTAAGPGTNTYYNTSLAIGSDGFLRIATYNDNDSSLFIQCTNLSCSTSNSSYVSHFYSNEKVFFGSDGMPRILGGGEDSSYNEGLYLAVCSTASCSSYTLHAVEVGGTTHFYYDSPIGYALGSDGFLRIVYAQATGSSSKAVYELRYTICTSDTCDAATSYPLDESFNTGSLFATNAMDLRLTTTGTPYAFYNNGLGGYRLVNLSSASGATVTAGIDLGTPSNPFQNVNAIDLNLQGGISITTNDLTRSAIQINGSGSYISAGNNLQVSNENLLYRNDIGSQLTVDGTGVSLSSPSYNGSSLKVIDSGVYIGQGDHLYADNIDSTYPTLTLNVGTASGAVTISQSGKTTTVAGNLAITGTSTFNGNVTVNSGKTLTAEGTVLLQNNTNSTTALQVKRSTGSTGTAVMTVDTANSGLILQSIAANDKATIGSELATSPTCTGTNWSGTGPWTHTSGSAAFLSCTPPASITKGAYYQITFDISSTAPSGEYVAPYVGGNYGSPIYGTQTASGISVIVNATYSTQSVQFYATSGWTGTISNISLKKVTTALPTFSLQNASGTSVLEIRTGASSLGQNTFIGLTSGTADTTGYYNTATGVNALQGNTTGYSNSAYGLNSLSSNASGANNVAMGTGSLKSNISGSSNVAIGGNALQGYALGSNNTAVGYAAGGSLTGSNASGNVFLGYQAGYNETGSNKLYIANSNTSTPLIYGDFSASQVGINGSLGVGTQTPGAKLDVQSAATTGIGLNVTANSLTTGNAVNISSTSASQTAGSLLNVASSPTLSSASSVSGNLLNLSRNVTANISGQAAIALDATSTQYTTGGSVTSLTWAHTVGSGPNRFLLVELENTFGTTPTSVTYAGSTMTLLGKKTTAYSGAHILYYGLVAPTTGTNNIVITSPDSEGMHAIASSWYNVDQSAPTGTFLSASGTGVPTLTATTNLGQVVVDGLGLDPFSSYSGSPSAGQTALPSPIDWNSGGIRASYFAVTGTSTTTSWGSTTNQWAYGAIPLNVAGGVASVGVNNAVASFSNTCTQTLGTCADATNILSLNQQFSGATGAVLKIQNAGSGDMLQLLDSSGTVLSKFSANGSLTINNSLTVSGGVSLSATTNGQFNLWSDGVTGTINLGNNTFNGGTKTINIGQSSTWGHSVVNIATGNTNNATTIGSTNASSTLVLQSGTTTLIQASASGTTTLGFTSPTTTRSILLPDASGTLCLNTGNCNGGGANGGYIVNGTTQQVANFNIVSASAANIGAFIQGAASATQPVVVIKDGTTPQTGADLLQLQNSSGDAVASFSSGGALTIGTVQSGCSSSGNLTTLASGGSITLCTGGGNIVNEISANSNDQLTIGAGGANFRGVRINGVGDASNGGRANFVVRQGSGATNDAFTIQNNSGGVLTRLNSNGDLQIGGTNSAASTTALQVQNTNGSSLFTANTSNMQVSIGSLGTPTGQLYVAGSINTTPVASIASGNGATSNPFVQGRYTYFVTAGTSANSFTGSLKIEDTTNPASPTQVGSLAISSSYPNPFAVYVAGHYAYVVAQGTSGNTYTGYLLIIDVSNPSAPVLKNSSPLSLGTHSGPDNIFVSGRYAYIAAAGDSSTATQFQSKLYVVDVSNPASPTIANGSGTSDGVGSTDFEGLFVANNYAYITETVANKLVVFDVSNPTSPTIAGGTTSNLNLPNMIFVQGRYAYVVNYGTSGAGTLVSYDISNPTAPTFKQSASTGSNSWPWGVFVQGRYAYVGEEGSSTGGIGVFDISTPSTSITQVSTINTGSNFLDNIFVSGRYLYAEDFTNGNVLIYDLGGTYSQQLEGGGAEFGTLQVDSNANFAGDASIQGGVNIGQSLQVTGNVGMSGQVLLQNASDSATAFQVQDSTGTALFTVDASSSQKVVIGTATNGVTISVSGGIVATGAARHTKAITLTPEYAGAVLDAAGDSTCSSASTGTMTAGLATGLTGFGNTTQNYYKWATTGTAQCYDVVVQVPIPTDFSAWASTTPLTINGYTTDATNGTIYAQIQDTTGTTESNYTSYASVTPGMASTWTTVTAPSLSGTYTAGGTMTIRLRMTSSSTVTAVELGNISLSYLSKF